MKKFLNVFMLLALLCLASCSSEASKKLANEVEEFNKDCPQQFGTTILRSIVYDKDDNEVVMTYIVDEKYTDISSLSQASDGQRRYLHAFLRGDAAGSFLDDQIGRASCRKRV